MGTPCVQNTSDDGGTKSGCSRVPAADRALSRIRYPGRRTRRGAMLGIYVHTPAMSMSTLIISEKGPCDTVAARASRDRRAYQKNSRGSMDISPCDASARKSKWALAPGARPLPTFQPKLKRRRSSSWYFSHEGEIPDLAAYEKYRGALAEDPKHKTNVARLEQSGAVIAMNRSFIRRVA